MWQMNLRQNETMHYPERPEEPDCAYYIRTGLCRFGMTCKFNHPYDRRLAAVARINGGYPERPGQPACQYFLRTGDCKFGVTCKFHHPKDMAGIAGRVQLNIIGYPLRPNEKECAYYLRTGLCKFGNTCKFHHPKPSNAMISARGSPVYPPVHSPTTPGHAGGLANWPLSRTSFIPNPHWQGPSSYAQLVLPQGLVQVSSWNPYSGQLSSVSSPENQQPTRVTAQIYNTSRQNETTTGSQAFPSYQPGAVSTSHYTMQRENVFPERRDQPECQFYMKTGDCKFGATCKFHHPRERLIPIPNCVLSPLGLPLRPGEPLCLFYSRYGICKFGPSCKFDHPVGTVTYSPIPYSAAAEIPAVQRLMGSSSGPPTLTLSSEGPTEAGPGKSRRLSLSEPRQTTCADENIEAEGSHVTSSIGQVTSFS